MVNSTGTAIQDNSVQLSKSVQKLLLLGGLVDRSGRNVTLTKQGFAFILQEVNAQVWSLLILYLENAESVCPTRALKSCIGSNIFPAQHRPSLDLLLPLHPLLPNPWPILLQSPLFLRSNPAPLRTLRPRHNLPAITHIANFPPHPSRNDPHVLLFRSPHHYIELILLLHRLS